MLARHRYTRCVNDVGLDAAHLEPARHPEAVTASLEGDCNALDPASCFLRFLSPSMQQLQQCALVDRELFQRLALDARYDTSNEPARQAHLNDRNQRAVRLEGGEGSAQVVQLLHGVAPSVHISDDGMQYPRRRPIASSIMGFEDEAEQSFGRPCRQKNGRTKRTHELTSSIVPRGTSFHCWVELLGGLAVRRTAGPSGLTNSPHPSSREGHLSTAGWNSGFLPSGLILNGFHAAVAASLIGRSKSRTFRLSTTAVTMLRSGSGFAT